MHVKKHHIKGKVTYQNLEGGFWGIIDERGTQWQPVQMPEQLKIDGKEVNLVVQEERVETIAMWGIPVRILSFHT